jgi:hypothetical protein
MAGYREMVSYELNAGNKDRSENEKYRDARIPAGSMMQYFSGGGYDPWISMCPGNSYQEPRTILPEIASRISLGLPDKFVVPDSM